MKVNLYDFDNTIYDGDSSTDFFFYSMMCYPKIIKYIPTILLSAIKYKLHIISKTQMKEKIFSFVKTIPNIDDFVLKFWDCHECYIKKFYKEKKHNKDIIISASPEFLLKPIANDLKVYDLIASNVNKNNGKFKGLNCHGEEKVKRLYSKYKKSDLKIEESYSDSRSDIPILKLAKKSFYVKGNKIKPTNF